MQKKVKEIARFVDGEVIGDGDVLISGVNGINEAVPGDLSFILNPKYEPLIEKTKASCVIVPKEIKKDYGKSMIRVKDPSTAFSKIVGVLAPDRIPHPKGIHSSAMISKKAVLARDASVGAYAVIEDGVSLGEKTVIYPFSYIGKNTKIGRDCIIYPGVVIREEVVVGNRVIIHSNSVIGSDGFGYDIQPDGTYVKIPQVGVVVVEDDVEIGSCVTIDRARFAKTVIGKGTKIDNLCQIAHNVILGPNCAIAAQTGISGSSVIGRNVVFGGQVGVADHLKIGDFVRVGAKTGITKSFPANTTLFWYPAKPADKARDIIASVGLLPKLYERVRALEAKVKELEK
jgi:UDP-3-O-[3-hydroxymyristoyl] glucosamine N-acyltransferase